MVNVRHGIARIGYTLLAIWLVGWILVIAWGVLVGNPDWSEWPILLTGLIGYPLGVFLLWRMVLWFIYGVIRPR
jgi:hypothetical protein